MYDFEIESKLPGAIPELEHAAWISARQYIYMCFTDLFHLLIQNLHRQRILRDVVYPGAAAALIRALDFHELNSGDRFQQLAGLALDALSVNQVARVVVTDAA